jgi:hypothetical protein
MQDQIDFIVADLDQYTRGEVIALALNVNANLRDSPPRGTPIDTGWASANWVPSIGQPFEDKAAGAVRDPTPAQVMARGQLAEQGVNETLSWRNNDGPLFSTNNVPYIGRLNDGWSGQSPAGFVQAAMERAIRQTYSRAGAQASRNSRASSYRASKRRPR